MALEEDPIQWCHAAKRQAHTISKRGKNWYVYTGSAAITINANNLCVITAHKINPKVRYMGEADYGCLPEQLYYAIYVPEDGSQPPREVVNAPEIFIYIEDFGASPADTGVVAEQNGQIIGAAWTRIIQGYGHIDNETPELAISVLPGFRGLGIGTKMMAMLFGVLKKKGYLRTSLSVHKDNLAVAFYERLGYETVKERDDDLLMVKRLV
ncbi:MAG: GNAT family N-acetyltransferase [Eubacteriaceae bacterium]|nr:GNAT family N-acetyltransferase [Eubacteriaceae bacterium]